MEERVLMQEFLTSKLLFKILPKYSILISSFRANKLDTTCANSNASKQIIYLKCIIWWKCPKLSHKEIETDLSFWKRSLRLREKFCKNQLPIYHTSQKSFSHNIYQPLSLSSGKFLFFLYIKTNSTIWKIFFLLLLSFDIWAQNGRYYQEEFPSFSRIFYLKSSRKKPLNYYRQFETWSS